MLYIVGTPIGNLDDVSYRQAKILSTSSVILAEDTRSAHVLLRSIKEKFKISFVSNQQVISYFKGNEFEKLPYVIDLLNKDLQISLISESGMPLISDPGGLLIQYCRSNSVPVSVVPGPSSVTAAVVLSGCILKSWTFIGFFPKQSNDVIKTITLIESSLKLWKDHGVVAFESPERFQKTMSLLQEHLPNVKIAACREMTKQFEEVIWGTPKLLASLKPKGEITLVISQ